MIRAAVVPDHDVALAPLVAILGRRLDHVGAQFLDDRVALRLFEAFDAQDLSVVVVERRASGLGMRANERMSDRRYVTVFFVQQAVLLPAAAVLERAVFAFEAALEVLRKRLVRCVSAREKSVPTPARDGDRVKLRCLVCDLLVRAVSVKASAPRP